MQSFFSTQKRKRKKKDRDKTYNKYIIKSLWTEKPSRNLSLESTKYRPDFRFQKLLSCWTSQINIIKVVTFLFFFEVKDRKVVVLFCFSYQMTNVKWESSNFFLGSEIELAIFRLAFQKFMWGSKIIQPGKES